MGSFRKVHFSAVPLSCHSRVASAHIASREYNFAGDRGGLELSVTSFLLSVVKAHDTAAEEQARMPAVRGPARMSAVRVPADYGGVWGQWPGMDDWRLGPVVCVGDTWTFAGGDFGRGLSRACLPDRPGIAAKRTAGILACMVATLKTTVVTIGYANIQTCMPVATGCAIVFVNAAQSRASD